MPIIPNAKATFFATVEEAITRAIAPVLSHLRPLEEADRTFADSVLDAALAKSRHDLFVEPKARLALEKKRHSDALHALVFTPDDSRKIDTLSLD
jgi:hypothetical protein